MGTLKGSNGGEGPAWTASSLVLDWGNTTSLNPVDIIWKIGLVEVEFLDSTFFLFTNSISFDVTKDSLVLGVCPVGKLILTEGKVLFSSVVLGDDSVIVHKSLKTKFKLLDVIVNFVEAGNIIHEVEPVDTDGGGGRSKCSKSEILHLIVIRFNFIINWYVHMADKNFI